MARLRFDNLSGTLGASLTAGGTTLTFGSAPSYANGVALPAIASPDVLPISIDAGSSSYERVWITAYAGSGATTATIARGQEGTTGVTHSSGAMWVAGPGGVDFAVANSVNTVAASGSGTVTIPDPWAAPQLYSVSDVTLTGNPTFSFPTAAAGKTFAIVLRQDATGGRKFTFPTVTWLGGGVQASTAASAVDVATFVCTDGTHWIGTYAPQQTSTGWTNVSSFTNNWSNFGSGLTPARYLKDALGFVHLEGVLQNTTANAASNAFQLPAGYRPGYGTFLPAATERTSSAIGGIVGIDTSGNVNCTTNAASPYLCGFQLVFLAEN